MKNNWSDSTAKEFIKKYEKEGVSPDLALRVYTSRLLGQEPKLVIHGGGNTSVKTKLQIHGENTEVLCVKGSGWDLGHIEPAGLPAVKINPLRNLISLEKLSDEDMVNTQRANLLDSSAPNPSVETLLHAFLPHKFIDHTHSDAILALCNQPNGAEICKSTFGNKLVYVPYIMPGFALAKQSKICFEQAMQSQDDKPIGMLLLKHGLVSFGKTAKEAYDRMIHLVSIAEEKIDQSRKETLVQGTASSDVATPSDVAPILRGLLSRITPNRSHQDKRLILEYRTNAAITKYVGGKRLKKYSQKGTVTPDHVIRIKPKPLILSTPVAGKLATWEIDTSKRIKMYIDDYKRYFNRNNPSFGNSKTALDPTPKVILVPNLGLFATGNNLKNAKIAGDLGEVNAQVITNAEEIGSFECITEREIFEIEHWSLEQAKLAKTQEKALERQVVIITGAGGGIGSATAHAFANEGAEVVLLDIAIERTKKLAKKIGGTALYCDVTDIQSITSALSKTCEIFGGVDILVSNAGAAWEGEIGSVSTEKLKASFSLNFWSHQFMAQGCVKIMMKQKTGGCLLFNTSKQAVNPGKNFGPYGLPKATTLFLMKQYALDHGKDGIRSNAVNADRIRSGLLTDQFITSRAAARGIDPKKYMSSNLLNEEVLGSDVADAFVYLAKATKTSAAVLTVDGGNIEASLR